MATRFAKLISVIFHPVWFPLLTTGLYFLFLPRHFNDFTIKITLMLTFIGTILLPITILYLLKKGGVVEDYHLSHHSERKFPLIVMTILAVTLGRMFYKMQILTDVAMYFMSGALGLIINYWFLWGKHKISLHTTAIGASIGFFMFISHIYYLNYLGLIILLFLLFGLVGKARVDLGAHNVKEVLSGLFIGIATQLIFPMIVQNI
jgi:membrane-associated phospholipid phosphatase